MIHQRKTRIFTFDLDFGVMVTQNVAQNPPYYLTYAHAKADAARSSGLGDAFTRTYIIRPLTSALRSH